jgi:hypothetical protein
LALERRRAFNLRKGIAMKRIARALVIVTLASAATAAVAADSPFPASVENQVPLSEVFPNIVTYKQEHHDSAVNQPAMAYPSKSQQEIPLSEDFPNIVTYKQEHKNDPARASNTSAFPEDLPNEPSMADEGLVPGIAGVAPYVSGNSQGAVGATR